MELEYWLSELRRRAWTLHLGSGDPRQPDWLAAHYAWHNCADVLILRGEESAIAFRAPAGPDTDILAPAWVTWVYSHNAIWTLRAVLTIEPPGRRASRSTSSRRRPRATSRGTAGGR